MNPDTPRLIEVAFPLKQASLDSVHEKNVRHGHISTLHIWPARRPLAACRAALICTLLPDPGNAEERKEILERLAGRVVKKIERKKMPDGRIVEREKEETEGGILHWGRESGADLQWFREKIRAAYGGRAPKVLDPFAGGGAIPLEAMRLGCEATAIDINPVAWFILKCTLEYPQKLAGQKRPLPEFILRDAEFMEAFFKAHPGAAPANWKPTKAKQASLFETPAQSAQRPGSSSSSRTRTFGSGKMPSSSSSSSSIPNSEQPAIPEADLAWHVRAWGRWVLERARAELEPFYPTVDGKPTVAYLWARTVQCKNCRATIPLLKTRWLCKKPNKRVLLTMEPNAERTGVVFGVQNGVPVFGGNPAQRREHDRSIGAGTMSRSGAACRLCEAITTMEDMRFEARGGRLGAVMTAVVVQDPTNPAQRTPSGTPAEARTGRKTYRDLTAREEAAAVQAEEHVLEAFASVPFGLPREPTPVGGGSGAGRAFAVHGYGLTEWGHLFAPRQLLALGTFIRCARQCDDAMPTCGYPPEWREAVVAYLSLVTDRISDRGSSLSHWDMGYEKVANTFTGYRLPVSWDYAETGVLGDSTGSYAGQLEWVARFIEHATAATAKAPKPRAICRSAVVAYDDGVDLILTDPPYYDAIPYADLMDFFYVWLRRSVHGLSREIDAVFERPLTPKWDLEHADGELVDDETRFGGDRVHSKAAYEDGMSRAFGVCGRVLAPAGRAVIVFANKQPDAWETLVSALITAGFTVDASWPVETEMGNRTRAIASAALSSSVWLVCKKRPEGARPGWDNRVLEEMRGKITTRLREFWDAGIRGPDFVWAATGPALEAYSQHPVVRKANEPGELMSVSEFLRHVRRMVVDFVVGRVLSEGFTTETQRAQRESGIEERVDSGGGSGGAGATGQSGPSTINHQPSTPHVGLDDVTTYYLLHRHDFRMGEAPVGACILYATSCNLGDAALVDRYDLLQRSGGKDSARVEGGLDDEDEDDDEEESGSGAGATLRLKPWSRRTGRRLGYEAPGGRAVPLIDQAHRLMHLWKAGEVAEVEEYLDGRGLRRNVLFHQLLQALIELAEAGSEERSLLESISNHAAARGPVAESGQRRLGFD